MSKARKRNANAAAYDSYRPIDSAYRLPPADVYRPADSEGVRRERYTDSELGPFGCARADDQFEREQVDKSVLATGNNEDAINIPKGKSKESLLETDLFSSLCCTLNQFNQHLRHGYSYL